MRILHLLFIFSILSSFTPYSDAERSNWPLEDRPSLGDNPADVPLDQRQDDGQIAIRDRDPDLVRRYENRYNLDYQQNWRYDKQDYLSGQSPFAPEYEYDRYRNYQDRYQNRNYQNYNQPYYYDSTSPYNPSPYSNYPYYPSAQNPMNNSNYPYNYQNNYNSYNNQSGQDVKRRGEWGYQNNWRYHKKAYLSGVNNQGLYHQVNDRALNRTVKGVTELPEQPIARQEQNTQKINRR